MSIVPALWPDDQLVAAASGATYLMASGHEYHIAGSVAATRPNITQEARVPITRYIVDQVPGERIVIGTFNIEEIIARRPISFREKCHALMREIVRELNGGPGSLKWVFSPDQPGYCDRLRRVGLDLGDEILWVLEELEARGDIVLSQFGGGTNIDLPVRGLINFEDSEAEGRSSQNAFIAMWFNAEMTAAFEKALVPAIERWGYTAVRIDRKEHNNKIDDEIIAEIRRARFVVADFSCNEDGVRGGVYYEAGFAAGLGIPVIFTVRASDLGRVHFDTRQFNHIVWNDEQELRVALENRIGATIGEYRSGQ